MRSSVTHSEGFKMKYKVMSVLLAIAIYTVLWVSAALMYHRDSGFALFFFGAAHIVALFGFLMCSVAWLWEKGKS